MALHRRHASIEKADGDSLKFNQLAEALKKVNGAEVLPQASIRSSESTTESARPADSVRDHSSAVGDRLEDGGDHVRGLPGHSEADGPVEVEPNLPLTLDRDIKSHTMSYERGASLFGYDPTLTVRPRGLLVGECPGSTTDPRMPLFPDPPISTGARLLGYTPMTERDFLSLIARTNLCPTEWFNDVAELRAEQIMRAVARETVAGRPVRVLMLGRRVMTAWGLKSREHFGIATLFHDSVPIEVGWIPHPSGLNRIYNELENQRKAGALVQWVAGVRIAP